MGYTEVDLDTYPRRYMFDAFRVLDIPYLNVTLQLDLTEWHVAMEAAERPVYPTFIHHVAAAANAVEAFRLRIRGERLVRHDVVHPQLAVPWRTELYNLCMVTFEPDAAAFLERCLPAIEAAKSATEPSLDEQERDDLVGISCLPWFDVAELVHIGVGERLDSLSRVAWGRPSLEDGRLMLPFDVRVHQGVADAMDVARFTSNLGIRLATEVAALSPA